MKNNSLYSLLQVSRSNFPHLSITNAKTRNNIKYSRIAFETAQPANKDWSIIEAHLSIYKDIEPNNAELGPSHVTVNLLNSSNEEFRLHVFFDENDNIIRSDWHQRELDNSYTRKGLPQNIENLHFIAQQCAFPVIRILRLTQRVVIEKLTQRYAELNAKRDDLLQSMSEIIPNSGSDEILHSSHLTILQETQNLFKQLYDLSGHSKWQRLNAAISKTLKKELSFIIEKPPTDLAPQLSIVVAEEERDEEIEELDNQEQNVLILPTLATKKVKKIQDNLNDQFEKLCLYSQKENSEEEAIPLLNTIYNTLVLIALNETKSSFPGSFQQLQNIEEITDNIAKEMLKKLLLLSRFDLVKKLIVFYSVVDLNYFMKFSLLNHNSELLKFLIEEFSIPVNTFPITIDDITYSTALNYCFRTHSKKNPMLECTTVLIKAGANLLIPDDTNGLPIAHNILCEGSKHPLYPALEANNKKTVDNKNFYYQLIHSLENFIKTPDLSKTRIQSAKRAIQKYNQSADNIGLVSSSVNKNFQNAIERMVIPNELMKELSDDEDILKRHQNVLSQIQAYKKQWTSSQLGRGKPCPLNKVNLNNTSEDMAKILKTFPSYNAGIITLETMKQATIKSYDTTEKYLDAATRLLAVQDQINRTQAYKSKYNKTLKQLRSEQQRLVNIINELEPKMTHTLIKNEATSWRNAHSGIESMSSLLTKYSSLFSELQNDNAQANSKLENTDGLVSDFLKVSKNFMNSINQVSNAISNSSKSIQPKDADKNNANGNSFNM